ncbi:PrgI family protein [Patescibacteria group bacterium]|nr:PrgI family protein [Patescibacteria group bacterium]
MQFLVPQFIDTEDRIFGPISIRQFSELLVGFGLIYVAFKLSTFWLFTIEAVAIFGLTVVFAFIKVNGQPFHFFMLNLIQTMRRPRLKIWLKEIEGAKISTRQDKSSGKTTYQAKATVTSSRLTELSLVVDTGGAYKSEEEKEKQLVKAKNGPNRPKK